MPVPDIVTHGSSDGSDRQAPSSDAASTESSSSDVEETLENDYIGTQDTDFAATLGLDVTMNDQPEPEVLESDSDYQAHALALLSAEEQVARFKGTTTLWHVDPVVQ
ncbi:hypothetical protein FRC11_010696 [Ceratobasidium sp. 423]|nr:hypothetical protein FRC11_010696 [Ceratobasidium sp. 423]